MDDLTSEQSTRVRQLAHSLTTTCLLLHDTAARCEELSTVMPNLSPQEEESGVHSTSGVAHVQGRPGLARNHNSLLGVAERQVSLFPPHLLFQCLRNFICLRSGNNYQYCW